MPFFKACKTLFKIYLACLVIFSVMFCGLWAFFAVIAWAKS